MMNCDQVGGMGGVCLETTIKERYRDAAPQGPTIVCTGSGTPEAPELPSARGCSWATLSPGIINTETWSSRLGVGRGANNPTP
jgi:hypothetical protein